MTTDTTSAPTLQYEGSVKRVWQPPEADQLRFEFTDDYSVFDWGKMPDTIAEKGRALTVMGAWFFDRMADAGFWQALEKNLLAKAPQLDSEFLKQTFSTPTFAKFKNAGCKSHFLALTDESGNELSLDAAAEASGKVFMSVKKAQVLRPTPRVLLNRTVFSYPDRTEYGEQRLVPLEVVFRFGMPAGSSLKERVEQDHSYARFLGLSKQPVEGEFFDRPVIELFTKLEPKDRLLSVQEALLISGLTADQFQQLSETATLMALGLFAIFQARGVELWDGKFEFITQGSELIAADSIGPDELRLIYKGCHLSKEMIRRVYRGTPWEKAIKDAQRLAADRKSLDWKAICRNELGQTPAPFTPATRAVIDKLYGSITNHLCEKPLFKGYPELDQFVCLAVEQNLCEGGA
ncbi:MAG: hypothetical protein K2W95_17150 [Candidatus Obscuribacterales bacterium]|nr:hypothetical protein [Candidatus Obscuribacterales bacterium]